MQTRTSVMSALACAALAVTALTGSGSAQAATAAPVAAASATPAAAKAYPVPKNLIYGYDGNIHLAWDHIRGVPCYLIEITKRGYYGPWRYVTTKRDSITLNPKATLPYQNGKKDQPYDFFVRAQTSCDASPSRASAYAKVSAFLSLPASAQKLPVNLPKESKRQQKNWQKLISDCAVTGGTAMLETLAGSAITTAIAIWVPAVGEVTLGAVAAAAAASGVVADASCMIKGALPNRSHPKVIHLAPTHRAV